MLMDAAGLLAGLVMLYLGAESLVRGASALGLRFGLTPLAVGLTIVAFGTSAPELATSVQAAADGRGDIAVGNVVGSNIANILLILGVAALVRPLGVKARLVRIELPLVIAASLAFILVLRDGAVGRIEGAALFAGIVAYTVYSLIAARRRQEPEVEAEFAESMRRVDRPTGWYAALTVIGLAVLVGGARILVDSATDIARAFGLSEALIGLTLVAIGTSLPELAASAVAAAKREGDIAIGNVLGSNLFNVLCVTGVAALVAPLEAGGISAVDLGVMLAVTLIALPILRSGAVIGRIEGAGLVLAYGGYLAWLVR